MKKHIKFYFLALFSCLVSLLQAQVPQAGRLYYIYCDNDTQQYFHVNNSSLAVANTADKGNPAYIFRCVANGDYLQFYNMGSGKYLAHKGLSNSGYNFTVSTEGAFVEGNVTLYSVSADRYFVMNNNGSFDQATETYNKTTTDYSTDYKFVEHDPRPQAGKIYNIYCDNDAKQYFYNDNGTLRVSNIRDITSAAYRFKCTVTDEGLYNFECVDADGNGTGYFLKHKGIQNSAYDFELGTANTFNVDAVTLFSYNSDGDNRNLYFVMNTNGSLDQAEGTFNKTATDYSTDYIFTEFVEGAAEMTISIGASDYNLSCTLDGESIGNNYTTGVTIGSISGTLSVDTSNLNSAYTFNGFVDEAGNTYTVDADGNLDLSQFSSKTNDFSLTAQFTLNIFSENYGDKWVRLNNASNGSYWAGVAAGNDGAAGTTATLDYTLQQQLWCLVGTAESFTLYNYAAGEELALNVPISGTSHANGDAATLNNDTESKWFVKENGATFALLPKSNNNTSLGINMYGGAGGNLKLYGTAANNTGSFWKADVVAANPLTLSAQVTGEHWGGEKRIANLKLTVGGSTSTTRITESIEAQTYYMPKDKNVTLESETYRGYDFKGFVDVQGNTVDGQSIALKEKEYILTATYEANRERTLFYSPDANNKPYRIPAIATAPNGDLIAISDNRPCGSDIGYGEVDIKCRISKDNGLTWGGEFFIADGDGRNTNEMQAGYGDAAVVADRESNKVLVMMVCGRTVCHNGRWAPEKIGDTDATEVNRVARVYGTYDESTDSWSWSDPVEVTDAMYSIFVDEEENITVPSMFIGSGRIMQSRVVKKNEYYRLYCSIWTNNGGNRVIYSDDFGGSWNVLGTLADRPASGGDEPKCEELPDGTVILSSRKYNGRYFNLFTFDDDTYTTGSWGTVVASNDQTGGIAYGSNSTNGEIFCVEALNGDGETVKLMLQSIPKGNDRSNVGFYFKEIDPETEYTTTSFAENWTEGLQVSHKASCYSTMSLQADGKIAFFFEEVPGEYCMVYIPLTINEITNGAYYSKEDLKQAAEDILALEGVGYPTADNEARATLKAAIDNYAAGTITAGELAQAVTAYKGTTEGIQMPEEGKAYTITFSTRSSSYNDRYINFDGTTLVNVECDGNELPKSAHFVFRKFTKNDNTRYIMVPAYDGTGKYLTYQTVTSGYTADINDFAVAPLISTISSNVTTKTPDNLFGYVYFTFDKRGAGSSPDNKGVYIMKEADSKFDNSTAPFLNGTYTSALIVKEVEYQNTPTLNAIDDIAGISAIGTFSAPFATIVPEGVTAYYIKGTNDEGDAEMTAIAEGEAIPANQGVLLAGEAGKYTMVPAKDETRASLEGNLLGHSAGAAKVLEEGDNAYILTRVNGATAFYKGKIGSTLAINRSYLSMSCPAESVQIRLGGTTAIEDVRGESGNAETYYDLTGRRVNNPVKGGIYIKNNKKIIIR